MITANDELQLLSEATPWLDENEMAEMKPIQYKSRDGLTIHGYLTIPKGMKAKNLTSHSQSTCRTTMAKFMGI